MATFETLHMYNFIMCGVFLFTKIVAYLVFSRFLEKFDSFLSGVHPDELKVLDFFSKMTCIYWYRLIILSHDLPKKPPTQFGYTTKYFKNESLQY